MNRFGIFLFRLLLIIVFLVSFLNRVDFDGINNDVDGEAAAPVVGLPPLLFCFKICIYTKILIVAAVNIVYPQLVLNSLSNVNFVFTKVSTIPDVRAIDAITFINLWTRGNKVEYRLSLLAGNIIMNIKNIVPHHMIEEKK
jgi:hypothetical protein